MRRRTGRRGALEQPIKQFIQNVHHFRDEGLNREAAPSDHAVIFDEAQPAWNQRETARFMKQRKGRPGSSLSEPELLLSYMDRHDDWALVVCLVGGGQEINRGEAGISAWLDAVSTRHVGWQVYISPNLSDSEGNIAGPALQELRTAVSVVTDEALHLSVSLRSFRAENVSRFVKAVLDHEHDDAAFLVSQLRDRYPLALTRDLAVAKAWIRERARGSSGTGW